MVAAASYLPVEEGAETRVRYRLLDEIGTGRTASVYLARLSGGAGLQRFVALKSLRRPDEAGLQRFFEEARLLSRVRHRNVIGVLAISSDEMQPFVTKQYVRGVTLDRALRAAAGTNGLFARALLAHVVASIAEGLHAIHNSVRDESVRDIVHRELLSRNIILGFDGIARILDCGSTLVLASDEGPFDAAPNEDVLATTAPELLVGGAVDRRADIFSLGVMLWESTLGRSLFHRNNSRETFRAVLDGYVPPPREVDAEYPVALERIVLTALSHHAPMRPNTMGELAAALRAFASETVSASDAEEALKTFMHETFALELEDRLDVERRALKDEIPAADANEQTVDLEDPDMTEVGLSAQPRTGSRARLEMRDVDWAAALGPRGMSVLPRAPMEGNTTQSSVPRGTSRIETKGGTILVPDLATARVEVRAYAEEEPYGPPPFWLRMLDETRWHRFIAGLVAFVLVLTA